jgi:hypothetical protein
VQNSHVIARELHVITHIYGRLVCRDSNSLRKTGGGGLGVYNKTDSPVIIESNGFFVPFR